MEYVIAPDVLECEKAPVNGIVWHGYTITNSRGVVTTGQAHEKHLETKVGRQRGVSIDQWRIENVDETSGAQYVYLPACYTFVIDVAIGDQPVPPPCRISKRLESCQVRRGHALALVGSHSFGHPRHNNTNPADGYVVFLLNERNGVMRLGGERDGYVGRGGMEEEGDETLLLLLS